MSAETGDRSDGRAIRRAMAAVLVFQLGLALFLFLGDLGRDFALPRLGGPTAPRMDQPVNPGDQTRRYSPTEVTRPASPGVQTNGPLPERLMLEQEGGGTYRLTGSIAGGDAERILAQLDTVEPAPETFILNSPGGSVQDALALGRALRKRGVTTRMEEADICLSACPYLLAAGTTRSAASGARIGVHQHYFGENTFLPAFTAVSDIQRGQGEVMRYLSDMGVDPMMMSHALVTPPDEIYLLLPEELTRYNLLTIAPEE
ncbi:hypothetical protein [Pseudooceanicola aestuarii]|uniref:COG3904 family protein n=1 Tax=Pseudooceanicola aestuarii TaxID=2697319 RepID=UPI001953DDDB|nr:hypothetical protein [Pseudooceanicola aestuarii]